MEFIHPYRLAFENYLKREVFDKHPQELYDPINYIMGMGGKRLRPVLVLLGNHLFNESFEEALPIAYTVELFHNFSLVHDDIMDEASIRRNQPTVHRKFGINAGILSGDVMLVYCYKSLQNVENLTIFRSLVDQFTQVATEVCEGQQMDMNFETKDFVPLEDYLQMIRLKTAVLIAKSLTMGAIMGKAAPQDIQHLNQFGELMGIAFQLQDDILDAYGDQEKFGKQKGGDIIQAKKTYLVTKAMELADVPTQQTLTTFLNDQEMEPTSKVDQVLHIFDELNILEQAKTEKMRLQHRALAHLEKVNAPAERKQILENLSLGLLDRIK